MRLRKLRFPLHKLPDLVLHEIFLYLEAEDIKSLQKTNRRFNNHIRANRIHYKKDKVCHLQIVLTEDGQRKCEVSYEDKDGFGERMIVNRPVNDVAKLLNPDLFISHDHDILFNMSPIWWKDRKNIELYNIVDIHRYLPQFNRCTNLTLHSAFPKNLTEILASMNSKHLSEFKVRGIGELQCTDDDLRKIGTISNKMDFLALESISESSTFSNDGILDMIEIGPFRDKVNLKFSRVRAGFVECVRRRSWVVKHTVYQEGVRIESSNGLKYNIYWGITLIQPPSEYGLGGY